jgi:hypothetical protein
MSRSDTFTIRFPLVELRRTSDASRLSIPWIVREVELRWKLRWPCIHCRNLVQLLRGALFSSVLVNFCELPKILDV